MTEIKLHKRPLKGLKIIALALPLIAVCIWMILSEPSGSIDNIIGWVGTCFFGLGIPVGLIHTFDRRAQIIITEEGIWDRTLKQDEIKWEQIQEAYPLDIIGQKFIPLIVDETFTPKKKLYKWAEELNEFLEGQQANLNISQLKIDAQEMTNFLNEIISTDKTERHKVIKKFAANNNL